MGVGLEHYRLFFFDGTDRLVKAHEFLADDEAAAIRTAEAWREGRRMELWQRGQKVRCWGFDTCGRENCA